MDGDGDLHTRRGLAVAAGDLQWSFSRAGGPGGQNVNKTSTKATLVIDLAALTGPPFAVERVRSALGGQLRVTSQESSSQWRNRQLCLERAAALIDDAARPPTAVRRP
ncbi:MAG: aminoacyl-tRNA hydrolase [Ilumatobacteraceae bacterium]